MEENGSQYKKFEVKWHQGGLMCEHVEEKLSITLNKVSFKRKTNFYLCGDLMSEVKWEYKIIDVEFIENFTRLCELFLKEPTILVGGCDVSTFSIEITEKNGTKIIKNYCCNMKDNGFYEGIALLEKFVPQVASRPYFFEEAYEDNVEETEEHIVSDSVNKNGTKYFRDVDSGNIVRKRVGTFSLEYISKTNPQWVATQKNSSYEREYYFGEGNACLFDIDYEEAKKVFAEWGLSLKLFDEK